MMRLLLLSLSLFLATFVAAQPPPSVVKAEVGGVSYVFYHGTWYEIGFDFKSRYYTCPSHTSEHSSWTGEIDSWDAATGTLVFKEAFVTCPPDGLPTSGEVGLVRMQFFRCKDSGAIKARTEGGSWSKGEYEFR